MTTQIFADWQKRHGMLWGEHPLLLKHTLHQSPLFSEEALADLIDSYPRDKYELCHMPEAGSGRHFWREGEIGEVPGQAAIDMVRNGQLWINLRRVMDVDSRYRNLLRDIFDELESRVPGLQTYKHTLGILISSPKAQVFYHADIPGQSLWQIKGTKRVSLYPKVEALFPQVDLERVILSETEEDMPYEPWFDEYAMVVDLKPGEMMNWPVNMPHKVENHDCLNISVTTEHWSDDIKRNYVVHYANGILRNRFGYKPRSQATTGVDYYAKLALAGLWKYGGLQKSRVVKRTVDFRLDPAAPNFFTDIPAYQR